jgi:hypothetical protein
MNIAIKDINVFSSRYSLNFCHGVLAILIAGISCHEKVNNTESADSGSSGGTTAIIPTEPSEEESTAGGYLTEIGTHSASTYMSFTSTDVDTAGETGNGSTPPTPCETWNDTCPDGYKCALYSSEGGGLFNAMGCFPLVSDPNSLNENCDLDVVGEPADSCDKGLFCFSSHDTCTPFCTGNGDPELLVCPPHYACVYEADVFALCIEICDPLDSLCGVGEICAFNGGLFTCVEHEPDKQAGEMCTLGFECVPGTACLPPFIAASCGDGNCCATLCNTGTGDPCSVGEKCVHLFAETKHPEYTDLGFCAPT